MIRSPRVRSLVVIAAGVIVLGACGAGDEGSRGRDGAGVPGRTIVHAMGSTAINGNPQRVVALDPSFSDAALLLGADLVGYAQYRADLDDPFPDYLGDIDAAVKNAVNVGTTTAPDLERIVGARPDLIVSAKVRHEDIYEQLSKIAPTVFSETTGPTWKQNVVLLGEALGDQAKAERLIAAYEERAAALGEAIRAQDPEITYSFIRFAGEDTARLYSSSSFIGEIMTDMGIPRPAEAPDTDAEIFVPLSTEQILEADAGLIMVAAYTPPGEEGRASETQRSTYESNPLWDRLTGEVLQVDDEPFVLSVSVQGAHAALTALAQRFGVDPRTELIPS